MGSSSQQEFCLKWSNHQSNMLSVFDHLLANESFVDVTLACDGIVLKAHKMVLSACSPYFRQLLEDNPCQHPIVILADIRHDEIRAIVEFMYKGEVNVTQDQLATLLATAEKLKIKGLAEVTSNNNNNNTGDINSARPSNSSTVMPETLLTASKRTSSPPSRPKPPPTTPSCSKKKRKPPIDTKTSKQCTSTKARIQENGRTADVTLQDHVKEEVVNADNSHEVLEYESTPDDHPEPEHILDFSTLQNHEEFLSACSETTMKVGSFVDDGQHDDHNIKQFIAIGSDATDSKTETSPRNRPSTSAADVSEVNIISGRRRTKKSKQCYDDPNHDLDHDQGLDQDQDLDEDLLQIHYPDQLQEQGQEEDQTLNQNQPNDQGQSHSQSQSETPKRKRRKWSYESLRAAVDNVLNGQSNLASSKKYGVPPETLRRYVLKTRRTMKEQMDWAGRSQLASVVYTPYCNQDEVDVTLE